MAPANVDVFIPDAHDVLTWPTTSTEGRRRDKIDVFRGKKSKGFKDFEIKAKPVIWPGLSYMYHVRSTAAGRI